MQCAVLYELCAAAILCMVAVQFGEHFKRILSRHAADSMSFPGYHGESRIHIQHIFNGLLGVYRIAAQS